jgi:hypothetical protein
MSARRLSIVSNSTLPGAGFATAVATGGALALTDGAALADAALGTVPVVLADGAPSADGLVSLPEQPTNKSVVQIAANRGKARIRQPLHGLSARLHSGSVYCRAI